MQIINSKYSKLRIFLNLYKLLIKISIKIGKFYRKIKARISNNKIWATNNKLFKIDKIDTIRDKINSAIKTMSIEIITTEIIDTD